jgi:hypothetical protein
MKPIDLDCARGLFALVQGEEIEIDGIVVWSEEGLVEVHYSYEIISSNGASFTLYRKPGVTNKQIEIAKRMIRNNHDVVSLRVKPITEIIDRIEA